jgi:hypothetical protein
VSLVKAEYGPTLPALLRPLPRAARFAVWGGLALVLAVALWLGLGGRSDPETHVVVRGERTFNLVHGDRLRRVATPGTLLALDRPDQADRFVVRALLLEPYRGSAGGTLPVYADGYVRRLREDEPGLRLVAEGRTRVNGVPGYQVVLRGRRDGRAIYRRDVFLVEDVDGKRDGVILQLTSSFASGTPNAEATGSHGPLKQPLRTFRFGTERSGGE